ncbi:paeninodin family lasso peptide [Paenibacillus arenilitoris]|uniref:Paeninodin family lasso peptide n=1 Tax=Paenibacillus arenilitoris TaxID=2772299 RepID=A0A927CPY6_9BACL|nr:paeninodin family lasso peptide [Paenibacillus arenilitoris]MBD2872024.1 paeninodin family lasso peptide [Paenibacillus arenilitoris]
MQKKAWLQPTLEVLDVNQTMAGPGVDIPDAVQPDPTEIIHHES